MSREPGDPEVGVYRTHYDPVSQSSSMVVVEAVAAIEDRDPSTLGQLYTSIDTESLDELMRSAAKRNSSPVELDFTAYGYEITVESAGTISLREVIGEDDPGG